MSKFDPSYKFSNQKQPHQEIYLKNVIFEFGRKQFNHSQSFELINGDLLEVNGEYLRNLCQFQEEKKVMVVAIFGPQSSGKSTLLNFVFGCDFMSSAGRCTKGIYGTYFEISNRNMPDCQGILILDTEGLFSNYENTKFSNRKGFNHKLVLFCLQVCDLVIFNFKGDVTKQCQQLLQIAFDNNNLDPSIFPEIYFVLNLNGGDTNETQNGEIQKFCNTIIATNPSTKKVIKANRSIGMPIAFIQIKRQNSSNYVGQFLLKKQLPREKFYIQTKKLCLNLIKILSERGQASKRDRNLKSIFIKMDQAWSTINKYPILTKHQNIKIKQLQKDINNWKKTKRQEFLIKLQQMSNQLQDVKLVDLEQWSLSKQKEIQQLIQSSIQNFSHNFPQKNQQIKMNQFIKDYKYQVPLFLKATIMDFKLKVQQRKLKCQIQESQLKGFKKINQITQKILKKQTINKLSIPQKQKQVQFEECWKKREEQMKKTLDRKYLSQRLYQNVIEIYQEHARQNLAIKIDYENTLKQLYEQDFESFFNKLKEKFSNQFKQYNVFQLSDLPPIMNIKKEVGDLNYKYLDMSKYFEKKPMQIYFKVDLQLLKQKLQQNTIRLEIQQHLKKNNFHQVFVDNISNELEKIGFKVVKELLKQIISRRLCRFNKIIPFQTKLSSDDLIPISIKTQQKNTSKPVLPNVPKKNKLILIIKQLKYLSPFITHFQEQLHELVNKKKLSYNNWDTIKNATNLIVQKAIEFYINSQHSQNYDRKRYQQKITQKIIKQITKDLQLINLKIVNYNFLLDSHIYQLQFALIKDILIFQSIQKMSLILKSFSKYWKSSVVDSFKIINSQQQSNTMINIGKYLTYQMMVKEEYKNKNILNKYIKKEYSEFLKEIKKSNFSEFIRSELEYQKTFEQLKNKIKQQEINQKLLKSCIENICFFVNSIILDIDKDLKQVSQKLRYSFKVQLHFMAAHLIWKIRQQIQWQKKKNILAEFNKKKQLQKVRFFKLLSRNPQLQNEVTVMTLIQSYQQKIQNIINKQKQSYLKKASNQFRKIYSRKNVQDIIDLQLLQSKNPLLIMSYLIEPIKFTQEKYKDYTEKQVKTLKEYKYKNHKSITQDLLQILIQMKDSLKTQQSYILSDVFYCEILEDDHNSFLKLFIQIILKKHDQSVTPSSNFMKFKLKTGRNFSIAKNLKIKQNIDFISQLNEGIRITDLKIFLNYLVKKVQQLKNQDHFFKLTFTEDEIKQFRSSVLISICQKTCPCCQRICDIDLIDEPDHKQHQCKSGHQMRAIRGMKIQTKEGNKINFKASIQRCQDLEEYSIFQFNGKQYTWKDFKKEKQQWNLQFTNRQNNKMIFKHFWEIAGQNICLYHTQRQNSMKYVDYNAKQIQEQTHLGIKPTHYIFALDQSGSMQGDSWNALLKSMQQNLSQISKLDKNKDQRISIIKFNKKATIVAQNTSPQTFNVNTIVWSGGGTSFGPVFKKVHQLIRTQIDNCFVFISDGQAEYPDEQVKQLANLQKFMALKKLKIQYVSILIGQGSGGKIMEQIRENLNGGHNKVTNAAHIGKVFMEVLKNKQK